MDLQDLRIFINVVEAGSATRAASRLGMTQPGVTQHLARLEDEIGQKLFERKGRRLELNNFGREFLTRAKQLLIDAGNLKSLATGSYAPVGTLRLGLTDSTTLTVIPKAIQKFRKKYPGVYVTLDVCTSSEIEHGILREHYDIGTVTAGPKTHPQVDEKFLYYDCIDALVSKKHLLAKKKQVSLEELSRWDLFLYPRRSRTRYVIDNAFHSKKIAPRSIADVYFNSGAVQLAEAGIGVALLSRSFITHEMHRHKCAHLRIKGNPFVREICIARRQDAHLPEPSQYFYNLVVEESKKVGKY